MKNLILTVATLLALACAASQGQAINDRFANRVPVAGSNVVIVVESFDGTTEPGEPDHLAPSPTRRSLWWTWTAPSDGYLKVGFDLLSANPTALYIYRGDTLTQLTRVANSTLFGFVTGYFPVQGGTAYQIAAVSDNTPAFGGGTIHLWFYPPPPNDDFADRLQFDGPEFSSEGWTIGASAEPGEPPVAAPSPHVSVWFSWTVPIDGIAVAYLFARPEHVSLGGVFEGPDLGSLTTVGVGSRTLLPTFPAQAGHTYHFAINSWTNGAYQDAFTLSAWISPWRIVSPTNGTVFPGPTDVLLRFEGTPTNALQSWQTLYDEGVEVRTWNLPQLPPELLVTNVTGGRHVFTMSAWDINNRWYLSSPVEFRVLVPHDNFADRQLLSGDAFIIAGDTRGASREPGEPGEYGSLWFTWTAPDAGRFLSDSLFNSPLVHLDLYTGDQLTNLVAIAPVFHEWTHDEFAVQAGTTYQLRVFSLDGLVGNLFSARLARPLPNDGFAGRAPITTNVLELEIPIGLASVEPGEPTQPPLPAWLEPASVWYTFTPTTPGVFEFSSGAAGFSDVGVYTGDALTNLQLLAASDWPAGFREAEPGRAYHFRVVGEEFAQGHLSFRFQFHPRPDNDAFAAPLVLTSAAGALEGDLTWASAQPGEPAHAGAAAGRSVWYSFTAPTDGFLTLEALAAFSPFGSQPAVAVYAGTALGALHLLADSSLCGPVVARVTNGVPCWIAVDASDPVLTGFRLTYRFAEWPANDDFANRTVLAGLRPAWTAVTFGATREAGEPFHGGQPHGQSVWAEWIAPRDGWVRFDIQPDNSQSFAVAEAYQGSTVSNLTPVAGVRWGRDSQYNPHGFNHHDDPRFPAGQSLWIPVRTDRACQMVIDTWLFDLEPGPCQPGGVFDAELDFTTFMLLAPTNEASFAWNQPVSFQAGTPLPEVDGTLTSVEFWALPQRWPFGEDLNLGLVTNPASLLTITNLPPGDYIAGALATNHLGGLRHTPTIRFAIRPANDDFARRNMLNGLQITTNGTSAGASSEPGEPLPGNPINARSVWYSWTAPAHGFAEVNLYSWLGADCHLAVFAGAELSGLNLLHHEVVDEQGNGAVRFAAVAGREYQLAVFTTEEQLPSGFNLGINLDPTSAPFAVRLVPAGAAAARCVVSGLGERPVTVESSTNLLDWSFERASDGGQQEFEFDVTVMTNSPSRFFRALVP